ncbi:MAG: hypothetical protein N2321_06065 [Melioribacteraceae bacterium]|nr:hypothetical protein [Melioribacteraceae bacterium]
MILVTINTDGQFCKISLTNNLNTVNLTKPIKSTSKHNLPIFLSILKGLFLLSTKNFVK